MAPVKLYVYDLSGGMAKTMSFQLLGKQIDGVWHTSVVVFGKEIYYGPYNAGPGIQVVTPGRSHHGVPMRVEDMGETSLDEETFFEYINEMQQEYTGEKYHLLEFNCNSFTNDCIGFLTGGTIPAWIRDLPADFLSTPFGQALRPTIDNMYRRPTPSPMPAPPTYGAPSRFPPSFAPSASVTETLANPVQVSTNLSSFASVLKSHKATVAYFTSDTCPPCRMIAPVFKDIAADKASEDVAFVEVNNSVGMSGLVAREYRVTATPTFMFFLDGVKKSELKGANAPELKTQIDLLLFEAFPPHPHIKMDLPTIRSTSMQPILYTQVPPIDTAYTKLASFIDASPATQALNKSLAKATLSDLVVPFLKARHSSPETASGKSPVVPPLSPSLLPSWAKATAQLLVSLPIAELFPLIDFWRLAVLDERVASWVSLSVSRRDGSDITRMIFSSVVKAQEGGKEVPRNVLLTTLRFAADCFAYSTTLARHMLIPTSAQPGETPARQLLTSLLVPTLLHPDAQTRTAAASVVFNIAAFVQKPLFEAQRDGKRQKDRLQEGQGDWEVEIVSAVVEGLSREKENEDVVHRLSASLAFFLHLSPSYTDSLAPLIEVLQVADIVQSKLNPGGCGPKGVQKPEVKKLLTELKKLCSS